MTTEYFDHRDLIVRQEFNLGDYFRFEYDEDRNLARILDAMGRSLGYEWSEHGWLETLTDSLGNVIRFRNTGPDHRPTEFVDAAGTVPRYAI